ncbi:RNA polymerase sigma-70 factor, ECF subfamily [Jannaschia faecimaris]|uniref:RNA polymerase sigma-70 factor, ECF subfamily n=1 Tax=Jannaschia faecimaris TaxID=1244108 RepID=A0A1H3PQQ4_9RHOB|nr:sigma-70 family RNA polymerase sigma factor [Jannaschia faecimaris]SDZ03407.1 RNA polymerase sigma-70 factor, ECF subfamily [Jannaschia faecimaris]
MNQLGYHIAPKPEIPVAITASDDGHHWARLLVAVGAERDTDAFEALFRYYAPRVKAYLMRTGLTAAMAEDCMQDVMVTLWRKAHLYDPTRAAVSTWLFTIARNRKIDLIRRAQRSEPEDLPWGPEPEPDQADALGMLQESDRLAMAVAELPPKQRDLVERAYFGDATHSEIAAATGLPLGTIKSRIRLAIDRLRHSLQADVSGASGFADGRNKKMGRD